MLVKRGNTAWDPIHSVYTVYTVIQQEERKIKKQGELCVFSNLTGTLKFVFLAAIGEAKVFFFLTSLKISFWQNCDKNKKLVCFAEMQKSGIISRK